ncbi:YitT family protein [Micromonospora sp. NPDC049836]|uniref:membrane protein YczE n=1 Tax=Micromonospora sp. NPDC049836 TaxID=3364274 RepID=UPI0037B57AF3
MAAIGNQRYRPARRLTQLYAGLILYGVSMALMVRSGLGLDPWDVFHQGLARQTGLTIGTVTIAVGALVLLLWIPLRQRPGLGTVSNVVVIGLVVDATLALLPAGGGLPVRIGLLVVGIVANGAATGLYLGAALGPGPRDGLMTGYVARRPGRSIRLVRTAIEVTVLALGWLLGGTVGVGTVAYALAIGPLAQRFIPLFAVPPEPAGPTAGQPVLGRATRPAGEAA